MEQVPTVPERVTERSLGPCFSVVKDYADAFSRVLLCFSLTSEKRGTSSYSGSFKSILAKDIFEVVLMRRGSTTPPTYTTSRKSLILRNKEELSNSTFQRSDLPCFLQKFTLPSLAIRLIRIGVNACERLRKYHEAVELILIVLSSDLLTSASSRTVCFFIKRLLLDQGTHCGDPVACLKKIESLLFILRGLHPRHRLEIQTQIGRLTGEKSENEPSNFWRDTNEDLRKSKRGENSSRKEWVMDSFVLDDIEALKSELLPRLKCAPVVKLSAPIPGSSTKLGARRPVYLWMEPEEDATKEALKTSIFQVENWALQHYLHNEKFEKGLHAESRICTTLFVLLFYDLLYGVDRADAFYSMLQAAPLDLFTGDFYVSHRELVESRLEMISSAKRFLQTSETESVVADPISQLLSDTWTKHKDERCIGVNWNLFPDGESDVVASDESEVFWCLGPQLVASICRLLISDYTNWCSGLPDLTVWSPSSGKAKLVEVKGPSDQLSSQQVVWMDSLLSFGADVEICSVSGKLDSLPRICDHSSNTEDLVSCFFYFSSSS
ncbi:Fanconi-associated nuclease 1 [Taenia solium]|eukprot:TsM_000715700 transcript=TsM_000715700 gene=TsM_000715700